MLNVSMERRPRWRGQDWASSKVVGAGVSQEWEVAESDGRKIEGYGTWTPPLLSSPQVILGHREQVFALGCPTAFFRPQSLTCWPFVHGVGFVDQILCSVGLQVRLAMNRPPLSGRLFLCLKS